MVNKKYGYILLSQFIKSEGFINLYMIYDMINPFFFKTDAKERERRG